MGEENTELYAAFGLEEPADDAAAATDETVEPGAGPEDSKPADDDQTQESAETTDTESTDTADAEPEADEPVEKVQPEPQKEDTSAQDANYAAAFMGRKNPYTGEPILTKADFDKYVRDRSAAEEQEQREAAEQEAAKLGITPEKLEAAFLKTETGKKMQAAMDYAQKQAADTHRKAIDDLIARDISEIAKYDPTVKDVDTLKKTANGAKIAERVATGRFTWLEAWKLENFDAISNARSAAAKQSAMNAAASKDHLQSTMQRGNGEIEVPDDVKAAFAAFDITDPKEQREAYLEHMKNIKKG